MGGGVPQARCTRFIHGGVGTALDAVVGWQVLEEQDGTGETLATFVPSGRSGAVDEVVCFERDLIGSGLIDNLGMAPTEPVCGPPAPVAEDRREYWLHRDDQFSTTSVTDAQGQVVERYDYHDYGFPLILSPAGEPLGLNAQSLYASRVGNASLFTGREWDGESKLYHYRTRAYHPGLGRFMQIDRIGVWGDPYGLGSSYAYCASSPLVWIDGFGFMPEWMADAVVWATGSGSESNTAWQHSVDFAAGLGDAVSGDLTAGARKGLGIDSEVNYASSVYSAGEAAGTAINVANTVVGAGAVAKGVMGLANAVRTEAALLSSGQAVAVVVVDTAAAAQAAAIGAAGAVQMAAGTAALSATNGGGGGKAPVHTVHPPRQPATVTQTFGKGGVYELVDPATNRSSYIGRTNDLIRRMKEHLRDSRFKGFKFRVLEIIGDPDLRRGFEQFYYDLFRPSLNKIRPVSPSNPKAPLYRDLVDECLKKRSPN